MASQDTSPLISIRVAGISDMEAIQRCRYDVYTEMGYINPADFPNGRESDSFDSYSKSVIATTSTGLTAIGTTRLVLGSKGVLPIESKDYHNVDVSGYGKSAEISRLCVRRQFRNSHISLGMYKVLFHIIDIENIDTVFAVVDESFFRTIVWIGFPFKQIGEAKDFMGVTIPTVCEIKDVMPALTESENANMLGVTQLFEQKFSGSLLM